MSIFLNAPCAGGFDKRPNEMPTAQDRAVRDAWAEVLVV
jgi:hypothetical protein